MSVKDNKLTINQSRAIRALLEHSRIEDAARAVGVSDRTLYRWLNEPPFVSALRTAESKLVADGIRALGTDMQYNHETMQAIRDNENHTPATRLRAAQVLDNSHLRWRELGLISELEQRISELEKVKK